MNTATNPCTASSTCSDKNSSAGGAPTATTSCHQPGENTNSGPQSSTALLNLLTQQQIISQLRPADLLDTVVALQNDIGQLHDELRTLRHYVESSREQIVALSETQSGALPDFLRQQAQ